LAAPERIPLSSVPKLKSLYIVAQAETPRRPILQGGGLASAALKLAEDLSNSDSSASRPLTHAELAGFLSRTAAALRSPFTDVAGYQVRYSTSDAAIPAPFSPTAVLWIYPGRVAGAQAEDTESFTDKNGKQGKRPVFHLKAALRVEWRLESWPDRAVLYRGEAAQELKFDKHDREKLPKWLEGQTGLTAEAERRLQFEMEPHYLRVQRNVYKGSTDASKAAYKAAKDDDWKAAQAGWEDEKRRGEDSGYPDWNLGVIEEKSGRFDAARARFAAASSSRDLSVECEKALSELDLMKTVSSSLSTSTVAGAGGWFDGAVAVLPFSNDAVDVDAPVRLRKMVRDSLSKRGFHPLPIDPTDEKLRDLGVTQGEHLVTVQPEQLAEKLGAVKLLYGHVEEFRTVNAGFYVRADARLSLTLTDAHGATLWQGSGEGFREEATAKDVGGHFIGELAVGLFQKATRTWMSEEAEEAARIAVETLPGRP
jgi:hypothetical protein